MKKIILLALPLALALSPISMVAQVEHESVEMTTSGITISVSGNVVGLRQGKILATAFHPELTDDTRIHELFLSL